MTALAVLLVAAAALAWWGLHHAGTPEDYFTAGRRAGAWLVGVAGTAAAVSGWAFVGGPGLAVVAGAGSLWLIYSAPLTGALQCWAVGEPLVALTRSSGALTLPELLAARFSSAAVRAAVAVVVALGCVASLAVQAKAAAVLGEVFLGVPGIVAAGVVMLATTAYTAAGGMRAGLLADAFQGVLMGLVGLGMAVAAVTAAGGPTAVIATLSARRPELLGAFGSVPPARALAWYLLFCVGTCAQPHYLQKFLMLRATRDLRVLPGVLTGALAATLTVWVGVGLGGAALVASGAVSLGTPDDLTPRVMLHLGGPAVVMASAAVLAAMMSTAASFLNLAAAAVTRDLPAAVGRQPLSVTGARLATLVVAGAATAVALVSDRAVALLGIAGWGFFTAALLPALTLGLAWPGARPGAVVAAVATGALVDLPLELLRASLPTGLEPGLAGAAVGTLVLVLLSLIPRQDSRRVPPEH